MQSLAVVLTTKFNELCKKVFEGEVCIEFIKPHLLVPLFDNEDKDYKWIYELEDFHEEEENKSFGKFTHPNRPL